MYRRDMLRLISEKNRPRFQLWGPSNYDPSADELAIIFPDDSTVKEFLNEESLTKSMCTLNKDGRIVGSIREIVELPA